MDDLEILATKANAGLNGLQQPPPFATHEGESLSLPAERFQGACVQGVVNDSLHRLQVAWVIMAM